MNHIKSITTTIALFSTCVSQLKAGTLHDLTRTGNVKQIRELLEPSSLFSYFYETVDINGKDELGRTALQLVCKAEGDKVEIAKLLLEKNADRLKALYFACENGNLKIVQLLVEKGENINSSINNGETILHCACKNNNTDVIKFLVKKGAKTDAKNKEDFTPLHYACGNGNFEVVKLLIENGANPNSTTKNFLERSYYGPITPLRCALKNNALEIIKFLIKKGANPDFKCENGYTTLHIACRDNKPTVAKLLIEEGADIKIQDNDGFTPLHFANKNNNPEIIKLFLKSPSAPLKLFLKNGEKVLSDPDSELNKVLFNMLLSTVEKIVKTDEQKGLKLKNFAQKISLINENK